MNLSRGAGRFQDPPGPSISKPLLETLLEREALPKNFANALAVLTSTDLDHTTGLHIPVDAGVPAAFLR